MIVMETLMFWFISCLVSYSFLGVYVYVNLAFVRKLRLGLHCTLVLLQILL